MKLEEIKAAVLAGRTVHWQSDAYEVLYIGGVRDTWLINCRSNNHSIGLTWTDNVTLNGREEDFYIKKTREEELRAQIDKVLTAFDTHFVDVMGADDGDASYTVRRSAERVHVLVSEYRNLRAKE
jgi:hypothetical protein